MSPVKLAIIMRGIPGSGKTEIARLLTLADGIIHSTDDFFMRDGEYVFEPDRLQEYHDENLAEFTRSLCQGISVVVCDNTNSQRWEFEPYMAAAEEAGYVVSVIELQPPDPEVAVERSTHQVPGRDFLQDIRDMLDRWEPYP